MLISIAFGLFAVLTVLFAIVLLWRFIPRPTDAMKPNLTMHVTALSALAPESGNATELKAIADAIGAALNALADFGGKLDKMGPSAILAIFTVFFALLAFATAWVGRQ